MQHFHKFKDIAQFLNDAGVVKKSYCYHWLINLEKKGKLVIPRDPVSGYRKMTTEQVESLIKAFSPGGKGEWKP